MKIDLNHSLFIKQLFGVLYKLDKYKNKELFNYLPSILYLKTIETNSEFYRLNLNYVFNGDNMIFALNHVSKFKNMYEIHIPTKQKLRKISYWVSKENIIILSNKENITLDLLCEMCDFYKKVNIPNDLIERTLFQIL